MKDGFTVYTNPNLGKKEEMEEVTFELEIPDEESIAALFVINPYFISLLRDQIVYYPVQLEAEESFMAPFLTREVYWDYIEDTEKIRNRKGIMLAPLLHVEVEDENGENDMISIFDGIIQTEFLKFLQTTVMVTNPQAGLSELFPSVFDDLMQELEENGYLDKVINLIANYMEDSELVEQLIFAEDDEVEYE